MTHSQVSPQEAAQELLSRRKARASLTEFARYVKLEAEPAEHHRLVCDAIDRIISGEINRLMIFMPPGSAKSTYASILAPAYYLGRMGKKNVVTASYGDDLATNFGRRVRNLLQTAEYQRLFPITMAPDQKSKGQWETSEGGTYKAVGVGTGVTGFRGDLMIMDDLIKGREAADSPRIRENTWQWYLTEFRTRAKPDAAFVYIGTRWHEDEPAGRILPDTWNGESGLIEARDGKESWYVICLPAEASRADDPLGRKIGEWLWTDWFSPTHWEAEKAIQSEQNPRNWLSLYQQTPTAVEGIEFKREWFTNLYDVKPERLSTYMSGDFAVTPGGGDFTELAVWGIAPDRMIYVLDWWHGQTTADVWIAEMVKRFKLYEPGKFVGEGGQIRRSVEPFLKEAMRENNAFTVLEWLPAIGGRDEGAKVAAARSFQALCANGRVRFPRTVWAERVIDQLLRFPGGRYDDAVDTCSLFGRLIHKVWEQSPPPPERPKIVVGDQSLSIRDLEPKDAFLRQIS